MKTVSLLFGLVLHFAACGQNLEVQSQNHRADSIAIAFHGASLKSPEELAIKMVAGVSSNEEKFRIIFRWITDNISYDIKTYNHIRRLTKKYGPNSLALKKYNRYLGRTWYTRVKGKKLALCSGYSGILDRMCEAVGVSCATIPGYTKDWHTFGRIALDHAWNSVFLGDKWYLCDVTWASSKYNESSGTMVKEFDELYYMSDPAFFAKQHFPVDTSWLLFRPRPTLSDFAALPRVTSGFAANKINQFFPGQGVVRIRLHDPFLFSFTSNARNIGEHVSMLITSKEKDEHVSLDLQTDVTGSYFCLHRFPKRGRYTVTVFINRRHTIQYLVHVN
jgi:hypothetical protein